MPTPLLSLQDVFLTFGGTPLLEGADLSVAAGEKIALVGRNGSGKSTLLKIAAGMVEADTGVRFVQPGATLRYLAQEPDLSGFDTVLAFVEAGLAPGDDQWRAQYLLEHLGLSGQEHPRTLSGGEARRAALARVLAPEPDILLLDEPTNHLDLPAIEWLGEELKSMKSALILISHDRRFLSDLTGATVWLDRGKTRHLNAGFGQFEAWRDQVLEEEEHAAHKLDRQIAREEHWVRYGVTARRKRNVRRMSELAALRDKKRNLRKAEGAVQMQASQAQSSGTIVIDAKTISKRYDNRPIVDQLTLRVMRGDRLGIVGPNGAGKTTLINLLTGQAAPDSGTVTLGANLQLATLDQRRASLAPETSLKQALTGGGSDFVEIGGQRKHFAAFMKDFLFSPEQAGTPVGRLSGGERARVMLARALSQPSNVLVLDEPTNDLDLETLDLLQETVSDYPGTVIVVSHDRDFLDRVATSILAAEGEGKWVEYAGGYSDMRAQRSTHPSAQPSSKPAPPTKSSNPPSPPPAAPSARKKLSFNQQRALKTLPDRIARLSTELQAAEAKLADAGLYARDPDAFMRTSKSIEKMRSELQQLEDEWLEIEMLREEIEQN